MELTITAKIQILVTPADRSVFDETMSAYRAACNFVSAYIFDTHDLSQASVNKALYYEIRNRFGLGAQMAQSVIKTVIAKYRTILKNQKEWIQPSFKRQQCDLVWNRDYALNDKCFSVGTMNGRIKTAYCTGGMEQYFDTPCHFGTAKLVKKHGKYFLHIPVTIDVPESLPSEVCNVVGIDRGIRFLVTTYDSAHETKFVSGTEVKQRRAHYKKLRQELQMRKTPSSRRRLKAIGQRENRWAQDVNHCVSKALVESNPAHTLFVLEDLTGIRSATERVRVKDRYVSVSWAYYDLEQKICYKAAMRGSSVVKMDPRYTSQCCPACGHTEKANRDKEHHLFMCKNCGYKSNDDRIGAMNLYRKGIEYLTAQSQA